eukprot:m.142304 g.142304  ORF g.142304 m.142304 type:complete len:80 (-) comp11584_c7_seq1:1603-1842(-)
MIATTCTQDPECIKAHFRKAKAHEAIWEYDKAIESYQTVLRLDPKQAPAAQGLAACKQAKKAAHNADREKFKSMFGKQS